MEHEYKRDERQTYDRFTLNTAGSSARLVHEDEIDPAELRRKHSYPADIRRRGQERPF